MTLRYIEQLDLTGFYGTSDSKFFIDKNSNTLFKAVNEGGYYYLFRLAKVSSPEFMPARMPYNRRTNAIRGRNLIRFDFCKN